MAAITEDIKSKWYQALFEEDCLDVMRLLNDHPSLLVIAMDSEPSREVEGRKRKEGTGRTRSTWKGRTALHVGASRGCLQLIVQVLRLCNFDSFALVDKAYQDRLRVDEEFSFNKIQVHPFVSCDLCERSPIVGNRWKSTVKDNYDLCPDCYEQHGNEKEFTKIEFGLPHGPANMDTIPSTDRRIQDIIQETPSQSADSALDACSSGDASVASSVEIVVSQPERTDNLVHNKVKSPFTSASAQDEDISQGYLATGPSERTRATEKSDSSSTGAAARRFQKAVESTMLRLRRSADDSKRTKKPSDSWLSKKHAGDLLRATDGERGLTALAIAALSNNQEVLVLLWYGLHASEFVIGAGWAAEVTANSLHELPNANGDDQRKKLRQVMVEVALEGCVHSYDLEEYYKHRDFNFLPPEEYLFHFLFTQSPDNSQRLQHTVKLWEAIRLCGGELWRFVLELQDGQGRPPFHVAIYEWNQKQFLKSLDLVCDSPTQVTRPTESEVVICALTAVDRFGRTPVHRAAANGFKKALEVIFEYEDKNGQVAATYHASWRAVVFNPLPSKLLIWFEVAHDEDFSLNLSFPQSPIHAAIIKGYFQSAKVLLGKWTESWGYMAYRSVWGTKHWSLHEEKTLTIIDIFSNKRILPRGWVNRGDECGGGYKDLFPERWIWIEWDLVELACLVGAPEWFLLFVTELFKVDLTKRKEALLRVAGSDEEWEGLFPEDIVLKNLWHPLHLAASTGKYDMLNYFINDKKLTPFVDDFEGNSPLHHAMKVRELPRIPTHLFDVVDLEDLDVFEKSRSRRGKKEILDDDPLAERKGCINLLLEAGCEIFKTNNSRQLPYPRGNLNVEKFLSWWYTKKQEEFKAQQNNLNFATNAIAVTATLVATASYVGPLQPPMGYDANQIQYENVWVSIFIVCDTLSFYFAIIAITLSLIPSLPMPQQAMLEELQRTRGMVIWAVGILLPSIFFVFVAFACSSISVMSASITSKAGGILTILSTIIGVVLCSLAFILFSIRLLAFVYPKNSSIRYIYDLSNYVTKFSDQ